MLSELKITQYQPRNLLGIPSVKKRLLLGHINLTLDKEEAHASRFGKSLCQWRKTCVWLETGGMMNFEFAC